MDVQERYRRAVEALVADCERDPQVIAVVIAGSMANDVVWEKSDLDVAIVIQEMKIVQPPCMLMYEGIPVHAQVFTRSKFRALFESQTQNSFLHSYLAKGRLAFSRDPLLAELWEGARTLGERDRSRYVLNVVAEMTMVLYKAEKWLKVKQDPAYAALYVLFAAGELARVVAARAGELVGREALAQASRAEPELMAAIYGDFIHVRKTPEVVEAALARIHGYLAEHRMEIFAPILDYLAQQEGPVSAREIDHYGKHHLGVGSCAFCCEYLSDVGAVERLSLPARLTEKSRADVQEAAFYYSR